MRIREIIPSVHYVGVNDWLTPKFEGLWDLPNGMSYNSYIVKGSEKVALIDTAPAGSLLEYIDNLKAVLDGRKIDYLVVNHMEPDHSALMRIVRFEFPEIKIVVNKISLPMAQGYYHIDDPDAFKVVADGEKISLGDLTLSFHMIPMVHWPETMVTLLEERNTLFSCDAFGCFGALPGGIIDSDMNTHHFIHEMKRYYSCIVEKYSPFVQNAIKKLAGIPLDYICTSHGPVWHDRLQEVVGIYDRLSRREPEDGVTLVFGSMYGNTAELADSIATALNLRGIHKIRVHNATSDLSNILCDLVTYKGVIIGSPTYMMNLFPPIQTIVDDIIDREMKNKVFGYFCSFTWACAAEKKMEEFAQKAGWKIDACMTMKQAPSAVTRQQIEEFADNYVKSYFS